MTSGEIGEGAKQVAPGKYKLEKVPQPHPAFDYYVAEVGPTTGLCWVKGVGKTIPTSVYGIELKSAFQELEGKLEKVYGKPEVTDSLLPRSIWNEPKDWMMSLVKKERLLAAIWKKKSGATLPEGLETVGLFVSPQGTNNGFVSVEYSFDNEKQCDAEIAAKADSAL